MAESNPFPQWLLAHSSLLHCSIIRLHQHRSRRMALQRDPVCRPRTLSAHVCSHFWLPLHPPHPHHSQAWEPFLVLYHDRHKERCLRWLQFADHLPLRRCEDRRNRDMAIRPPSPRTPPQRWLPLPRRERIKHIHNLCSCHRYRDRQHSSIQSPARCLAWLLLGWAHSNSEQHLCQHHLSRLTHRVNKFRSPVWDGAEYKWGIQRESTGAAEIAGGGSAYERNHAEVLESTSLADQFEEWNLETVVGWGSWFDQCRWCCCCCGGSLGTIVGWSGLTMDYGTEGSAWLLLIAPRWSVFLCIYEGRFIIILDPNGHFSSTAH